MGFISESTCVCVLVAQSCPTLCNPMDCSPPYSSVLGILQPRILEWVARGSSCPRDWTWVSCIAGGFFTVWATRETPDESKLALSFFKFNFYFILRYSWFTVLCQFQVDSRVIQFYIYIYPFSDSFPFMLLQSIEQSSLCYLVGPCWLYILYVLCLVTQSCPTLCDTVDCRLPGFSVYGYSPGRNTGVVCHAL